MATIPQYPQRPIQHVIDTKAVRTVLQYLPADLLLRGMDERDYGIDLQVELFGPSRPSGDLAMFQIKGREKSFLTNKTKSGNQRVKKISVELEVRTIEYAMLFDAPFFLFVVSVADSDIYFIQLQRYVAIILGGMTGAWRTSKKPIKIDIPPDNAFGRRVGSSGFNKVLNLILQSTVRKLSLRVMEIEYYLRTFGQVALTDPSQIAARSNCLEYAKELDQTFPFFEGRCGIDAACLNQFSQDLVAIFSSAPFANPQVQGNHLDKLQKIVGSLEFPIQDYFQKTISARYFVSTGSAGHF